ncbi:MAG: ModD protein [Rhodocyclaceae bacterium]
MNPYDLPDSLLETLLHDDHPAGDATTWALGIGHAPARMELRARHAMVACCTEEAARMGRLCGASVEAPPVASGSPVAAGTLLLCLEGSAQALHLAWKPAQVLMEHAAGIATATAELVTAARRANADIAVACTRKQVPGTRALSTKAILAGGAVPHRLSLSETLLVFAEHRAFLADEPATATVARLRRTWPERTVVVEVDQIDDARRWIDAGADVVQLDKCRPEDVAEVVRRAAGTPARVAAAGGIHAGNAEAYAAAGAHILVTSWPYTAAPRDVAVRIVPR